MENLSKLIIIALALLIAGISPNLFVIAQAGMAPFQSLVLYVLLPSIIFLLLILGIAYYLNYKDIFHLAINGIIGGFIATVGLEIFRETGFRLGTMPGDLPRLMGVVMLNQFSSGPDIWSDLAGWAYHFWNGAAFGIIFSLLLGKPKIWQGALYGFLIGVGFMITPVVKSLGIGLFGVEFKDGYQFALTVTLAHLTFGTILALILIRLNRGLESLMDIIKFRR